MCELILASGSSRRHSLLSQLDLSYIISVPDIDESVLSGERADAYVARIANSKAEVVFENSSTQQVVLAADTIISYFDEILGKPKNSDEARAILQKLSGNKHEVLTAVCLKTQEAMFEAIESTKVTFRPLSNSEIDAYCATDEPYDKAGAYAIQGLASSFVEYISGSYTNVMGLPLTTVSSLLVQAEL